MKPKVELATPEKCSNFLCESGDTTEAVESSEAESESDSSCVGMNAPALDVPILDAPALDAPALDAPALNASALEFATPNCAAVGSMSAVLSDSAVPCFSTAAPVKSLKKLGDTYDLKQLFNYFYFGTAAISLFEVSRANADIKWFSDYFYLGTLNFDHPVKWLPLTLLASVFFLILSLIAARSSVKATARDSSPFHFSKFTRKILRSTAIILPIPYIAVTIASTLGYQLLIQADDAYTNGKDDLAISYLGLAEKLDPGLEVKVLSGMAMAYFDKNDYPTAADYAAKALALDPNDENALDIQVWTTDSVQETIEKVRAATLRNPNDGYSFRVLAEREFDLNHIPEALAAARRHAALHADESYAKEFLARVLLEAGKADEALTVIGAILPSQAGAQTHEIRATILDQLDRHAEAQSEREKARELVDIEAKAFDVSK